MKKFIQQLDRSKFVLEDDKKIAHYDTPLPIGYNQTISQPSLVLKMSLLLDLNKEHHVLEIGTGSGYQTAILSHFTKHVYTIELIPELSRQAKKRLKEMNFTNISFFISDGSIGLKKHAPFDRIIVTAASKEIPQELIEQLDNNGIMIIPIGPPELQDLKLLKKDEQGNITIQSITPVRFVEFKGKYGWSKKSL